jgi:hypothetical protein
MPTLGSRPPRRSGPVVLLSTLVALAVVAWIGWRISLARHALPEPQKQAAAQAGSSVPQVSTTATTPQPVAPGTSISAAEVLHTLGAWVAEHPNVHSIIETSIFGGGLISKMDVFAYTNDVEGEIVRVKADIRLPQAVQFQAQNSNGKVQIFFPRSGQLIEPDISGMLASMPTLAANGPGVGALLKLARTTFAESSADLRVVTLVIDTEALHLPFTSGDIYLSFRTDINGKLLGIEEQAQGTRVISTMHYVTFDKAQVMHDAPSMPPSVVVTGKSFQQALEEEARLVMNKPLVGTKI